jgi:glycosyltransferase involved in cell wall biosynthesis
MDNKGKMSVLFVPFGTPLAPATRYRVYQYLPHLSGAGVRCRVFSSLSGYITKRMIQSPDYKKARKCLYYIQVVAEKITRFFIILLLASRYKVVFIQRTTFPFGMERLLKAVNKNIVFDIDDSIYMPDTEEGGLLWHIKKYSKKKEVISILKNSKCVIVENSHIKNFVQKYCNKIYLITGPIDTVKNYARVHDAVSDAVTIGWIGSPSTTLYLNMVTGVLKELSKRHKIRVRLIGAGSYTIDNIDVEFIKWSEATEVSELHKFDIGIMPMPDNEWTRGKVGCKMLQYMANAVPAVVSYTPTNAEIIEDGSNGFLARSEEEWIGKLSRLITDPDLRKKVGLNGRRTAQERFSLQINAPKFLEILKNAGLQGGVGNC